MPLHFYAFLISLYGFLYISKKKRADQQELNLSMQMKDRNTLNCPRVRATLLYLLHTAHSRICIHKNSAPINREEAEVKSCGKCTKIGWWQSFPDSFKYIQMSHYAQNDKPFHVFFSYAKRSTSRISLCSCPHKVINGPRYKFGQLKLYFSFKEDQKDWCF